MGKHEELPPRFCSMTTFFAAYRHVAQCLTLKHFSSGTTCILDKTDVQLMNVTTFWYWDCASKPEKPKTKHVHVLFLALLSVAVLAV